MNEEQKTILKAISMSGASLGAFSGMIVNQHLSSGKSIDELLELNLSTRLKIVELSK